MRILTWMGLLSILKKTKRREKEMRVLVLGLDNSGKSTCVARLKGERLDEISPTLGFNIDTISIKGYKLNLWDIGGQKTIRTYWRNYFDQTDGIVWVVDAADRHRMEQCVAALHGVLHEEQLLGASLLILANKSDLDGALSQEEIAKVLRLETFKNRRSHVLCCSALKGKGVQEGFEWIVDEIASRIYRLQ